MLSEAYDLTIWDLLLCMFFILATHHIKRDLTPALVERIRREEKPLRWMRSLIQFLADLNFWLAVTGSALVVLRYVTGWW